MSEQNPLSQPTQGAPAPQAGANGSGPKPMPRDPSDPREVAARVMTQMNQVNVKKEELSVVIRSLIDVTQQLTRAYVAQTVTVEQLRRRVKALEAIVPPAAAAAAAATSTTAAADSRPASMQ
jgi:hypothetical protein